MPLNVRKVSVNLAVICFFILSIITSLGGLSPFVCCKRAMAGAVLIYIVSGIAVRLINMILIDAMITGRIESVQKSKDKTGRQQK